MQKETTTNDNYSPNWLDKHHLGFLNLAVYALKLHSKADRDQLVQSRRLSADEINALWPRPWLYTRTMVLLFVGMLFLFLCWQKEGREEASQLLPGLTVLGSLAMPITLLVFFWETNKWRSLTLLDVLRFFLIGSCLAITISFALQYSLDYVPDEQFSYDNLHYFTPRLMMEVWPIPLAITACVEEFAKALTIIIMLAAQRKECHILHGTLVGAAVGAGFAVFESAGYISMDVGNLLGAIITRSLTAPACHVAWGALMGGAVAMAAKGRLRFWSVLHPLTVGAFVLVCCLHFAWNYLLDTSATVSRSLELSVATWFLLLLMIWRGLHEIAREKRPRCPSKTLGIRKKK